MGNLYQADIDGIARADVLARAEIEKIARNKTLDMAYKREQIKRIAGGAAAMIEQETAEVIERLATERARNAHKARVSVVPSAEEAARLAYGRDALRERWRGANGPELFADWQAALEAGDTLTARLYADFLPAHLRRGRSDHGTLPTRYAELAALTVDALRTDEQRKAHRAAQDAEAAQQAIEQQARSLTRKLHAIRLLDNGEFVDADQQAYASEIRF